MLEGGDDDEREAAAHALGKVGINAPELIHGILPKLVEVLEFSKEATCGGVLFALGAIGLHYPEEVAVLVPKLMQYLDSAQPNAVKNAVAALGNIGSTNPELVRDALPKIKNILETTTDIDIKMNARVALGRLGDPSAM
jgi:HEAT repeat protein